MQVIWEVDQYQNNTGPLFLALGNFDGVHRGHQKLLTTLIDRARAAGGTAASFIFEPHPSKILFPDRAPRMLVSAEQKARLLRELGMDLLIYSTFSREMARWSPEEFVQQILVEKLHVQEVFVGFNYSFGYRGAGSPEDLKELGETYGFQVHIISPVSVNGEVASSSMVRSYLEEGAIERAFDMLGYYPYIEGTVVKGDGRGGATLGFPTANLKVDSDIIVPGKGVYVARAKLNDQLLPAVVNIGNVPTFLTQDAITIEAHIIDFLGDLYCKNMGLIFYHKIRDEKKFDNIESLVKQIGADRDLARAYLSAQSV
ncbi:MAG TPA: bifunctional riboflavin kinase/FAD synthetase [Syntrophomonadaceae bacterium]|nr:bifunctional riboflavin kinase/FAD synthetase [Syntrophomonadaceae bacterium]